jgi:hypothetical protein
MVVAKNSIAQISNNFIVDRRKYQGNFARE